MQPGRQADQRAGRHAVAPVRPGDGFAVRREHPGASKQELVQQIQAALREGDAIADFLKTGARAHYGSDSEKLVEFGIQPFRGRRRNKEPEPPPVPETAAPAESSTNATK